MKLGGQAKKLIGELVIGLPLAAMALGTPSYTDSSYRDQPKPVTAYAAETAVKPATTSGIPNERGGSQIRMPVKMDYETLPRGANPKDVWVFDKNDTYRYGKVEELGYGAKVPSINTNSLLQGDVADILLKYYPDIMTLDEFSGSTVKVGKNYTLYISRRTTGQRVYEKGREGSNKIFYDADILSEKGKEPKQDPRITYTKTGKSIQAIHPYNYEYMKNRLLAEDGNTKWLDNLLARPHAGFAKILELRSFQYGRDSLDKLKEIFMIRDIAYFLDSNFKGYPSGKYTLDIPLPDGVIKIPFTVENPDKPDPRIAMTLGENPLFENCRIPWDLFNPRSQYNNGDMKLSGTVTFDFPDILRDDIISDELTVSLRKEGEVNGITLYQSTISDHIELPIDTRNLSDGKYLLDFRFGEIPKGSLSNIVRRGVVIQNQPIIASQPKE